MATLAMSSFAQAKYQQYFRIEFTVPIVGTGTGSNTSVAATMKDNYVYCNPEHDYLDFQATDNPMGFRSTTTNYSETSSRPPAALTAPASCPRSNPVFTAI